jgi:protein phosphatase PTC7
MSRPKPGMGRELRRTLGQAKHSHTPSTSAVQLAPIVSQYASSSRIPSTPSTLPLHPGETEPTLSSLTTPLAHLSLIPQWDPPTAYFDPFAPAATIRDDIVIPYRPGRRIPPIPLPATRASTMFAAPRPFRITDSLRHQSQPRQRSYTSSTAPTMNANGSGSGNAGGTIDLQLPGISIPPSILSDTFSFTDTQSAWSFWTSSHSQATEPEVGLIPQQPPSPGPGTVKMRKTAEHTVFSTSAPAQQNTSTSNAFLNHYAASFPDLRDSQTLPHPPDTKTTSTYSSSLEFRIGASGLAKVRPPPTPRTTPSGRERPPPPRTFSLEDIKAPTELSSVQVGEDAYFTRPDSMCIADGVGGWARSGRGGANAARWSRLLTHFIKEEVDLWWKGDPIYTEPIPSGSGGKGKKSWSEAWRDSKTQEDDGLGLEEGMKRRKLDAVEIMQRGFEKCLSCVMSEVSFYLPCSGIKLIRKEIRGSSTCILALLYHSTLCLANLGDCALLLIRNGEVILRTSEMQHAFNHPLQVCSPHLPWNDQVLMIGGNTLKGRTDERCNVVPCTCGA